MSGVDLERMSRLNRDQPDDASVSQCKVEEPQEEEMLLQTKSIFAQDHTPETISPAEETLNIPLKVDVAVQISGTSSSESFRGFPNLFQNELIETPVIEDDAMSSTVLQTSPLPVDGIQDCHVPLEKLDIEPSVDVKPAKTKNVKCATPSDKVKKQIKTEKIIGKTSLSLRKKAVLYYDGYEYRKPRTCHGGSVQWECCKISCPATLQQKADGKLKLNHKHQPHPQQVVNDGLILDRKIRKRVPFLMTTNNHKRKFIYNDSFRYHFSQKLPSGQVVWTCEDQPEGCKAYVKITNDFRAVTPVFQHNHTAEMIVQRRIAD